MIIIIEPRQDKSYSMGLVARKLVFPVAQLWFYNNRKTRSSLGISQKVSEVTCIKLFSKVNSAEHEVSTAHKNKKIQQLENKDFCCFKTLRCCI